MNYPVLVERWTGAQALTIVCERCHAERVIDVDEISSEDIYECPRDWDLRRRASTEARCRGTAGMKHVEGDKCRGCGKLAFEQPVDGCCSRKCQLQAEYAESLKATR